MVAAVWAGVAITASAATPAESSMASTTLTSMATSKTTSHMAEQLRSSSRSNR